MLQSLKKITVQAAVLGAMLTTAPTVAQDSIDWDAINADRPAREMERDQYRHPKETLEFFGIQPGMTVVDALPGRWYGRILSPIIGDDGTYIAASYSLELYKKMWGDRYESNRERLESFPERFASDVSTMSMAEPETNSFRIWEAPEDLYGTVDLYLLFRSLHHLNKFDEKGLDDAALEAFKLVKDGGVVGIVQHEARPDTNDEWARGFNGYIKKSRVVDAFTKAGFVLEAESAINENPKDVPEDKDGVFVWRLPPSNSGSNEENKAIGESHRMTLKFRKPAE